MMPSRATCALVALLMGSACVADAQERPYFVTYSDHLENPRELEVSMLSTIGDPTDGSARYVAPWIEIEYRRDTTLDRRTLPRGRRRSR